jgi:hypothetical protein
MSPRLLSIILRLSAFLPFTIAGCASDPPALKSASPREGPAPPYVFVDGNFRQPGRFDWTNGLTIIDAIRLAGGFNEFAEPKLQLRRWDGTRELFRLTSDYRFRFTNAVPLRPGDHLINPKW